ncbi:HupE/UreJ family protein [Collimonas pratensis]|uniref:HupE / UreJ family protein n=1 Tax=Collimonas pratensis TaxID=279113 RepID=A0A127Q7C0_9BURK|nr:HupE/UreJ family protein [Collimonas pratensis]AMP05959.1 hupE / UreJ family protein [Collimonas pratensis]
MKIGAKILLTCWLLCLSSQALAHKPSDSYLAISVDGADLHGRWDVALRDLDNPLVLDSNGDGKLTWGELKRRQADIAHYAFSRITLASDGQNCPIQPGEMLIDHHTDGAYAVLMFNAKCALQPARLAIDYHLFADIDTLHKGLVSVVNDGAIATAILGLDHPQETLDLHGKPLANVFIDFMLEGMGHIWRGFDHALFLIALLLPASWVARGRSWQAVASPRPVVLELLRIVTAFTAAHAITLTLAAFHLISVPAVLVEIGIAVTILLAALNNIYPLVQRRLWLIAFAFGLIHGFGFANVLIDMALPPLHLAVALAGFNLGVEAGQLGIVLLLLPVLYLYRQEHWFKLAALYGGSAAISVFAVSWIVERCAILSV